MKTPRWPNRWALGGALLAALVGVAALALGAGGDSSRSLRRRPLPGTTATRSPAPPRPAPVRLAVTSAGRLPAPVQDPATTALGATALAIGGLDTRDVSVATIYAGRRRTGTLPAALHDAAAASDGRAAYLFGGGEPSRDAILRVTADGHSRAVGRLPAPASDVAAVASGGSFYVVGGYTGTAPLRTIVQWRPGSPARVVARLPKPLRYAAVASAGGRIVIAGGTSGTAAGRDVFAFDPGSRTLRRIGLLPRPLTHAAAATLGGRMYVIGGRGAVLGTQTRRILAIDPATGAVHGAGRLPRPLSDAGAAATGGSILVAGGRDAAGAVRSELLTLRLGAAGAARARAAYRVPPLLDRSDVYAADRPGALSPVVRGFRPLVYVPNSHSNTVDEIDPHSYRVVRHFRVGALPQHVVPSYDLRTLWVNDDTGNSLTPIDPRNGRPGRPVPVTDPYNLYFTPDGHYAVVMAEQFRRIDFRDAHTMLMHHALRVPQCAGVNHADFTADGRYMLASCEFGARLIVVDVARERVVRTLALHSGAMPQDVKLSPDGRTFYVADMAAGGVWKVRAAGFRKAGFTATGAGAHGLYVSRDSRSLYVSNRAEGSVSVIALATGRPVHKWRLPGHASPDMGGVSADGRVLWLTGRYDNAVYAISTRDGHLIRRIPVGLGPHGLCVYPQPGRYSLGHTGVFR
jgi:DNA-binding beta-propeller fold protein YncE